MICYLIYDEKDIVRNRSYIDWIIDEGKNNNFEILLFSSKEDFSLLKKPNFVINRSRFFEISEYFESTNIPVFNNSVVTRITNDKFETYEYLKNKNILMLETHLLKDGPSFYPCVVKSVDGHGGNEVHLVNNNTEFKSLSIKKDKKYVYQKVAPVTGKDLRIFIIGKEIIASVIRSNNKSFKSNYSLGGDIKLYDLTEIERNTIDKVIKHFDFGLVGIDFLFDENNNLILNEIEDAVGSRMLSELTDINIIQLYLKYIYDCLAKL